MMQRVCRLYSSYHHPLGVRVWCGVMVCVEWCSVLVCWAVVLVQEQYAQKQQGGSLASQPSTLKTSHVGWWQRFRLTDLRSSQHVREPCTVRKIIQHEASAFKLRCRDSRFALTSYLAVGLISAPQPPH